MSTHRNILITGGNGFVGRALTEAFLAQGHAVTVLDTVDSNLAPGARFIQCDLRDAAAVSAACEGIDSVIHNASMVHTRNSRVADIWAVNHTGSLNVLEGCRAHGVQRLLYMSSASTVYEGEDIENGDEMLPYSRISQAPYADSKIQAEKELLAASGGQGPLICAIRPHVVFGPGDNRFIPAVLEKAAAGKLKRAVGDRDKLSDFTYIDNLVEAVVAAEARLTPENDLGGKAYFVTNGEPMAFFDFIEKLIVELGYPPIRSKVPYWLAYSVAAIAETVDTLRGGTLNGENGLSRFAVRYMMTHHYFDIGRARRELDWEPRISLEEGIRRTAAAWSHKAAQAKPALAMR
ncbi:NAD-dependent epimerase/dehydratase family protein [Algiphilus sp.]|uniref:NAD-dependent epimerase/dehydratase family protein n=1 Tax=Algiphilus sp. TaxID=1872431 RepID=UPI003B52F3EA